MLPSKFSRTRSFLLNLPADKDRSDERPVGPASYEKEPIVGNPSMAQFKNQPSYSIPHSSTGRMAANRSTSSSLQRFHRNNKANLISPMTLEASSSKFIHPKHYHASTASAQGPGVGSYDVEKPSIEFKNRSPKAVFGREERFPKKNPL